MFIRQVHRVVYERLDPSEHIAVVLIDRVARIDNVFLRFGVEQTQQRWILDLWARNFNQRHVVMAMNREQRERWSGESLSPTFF